MEEFMNLKKGDIIKTALGEHTTVLDVKKNQVVLFTGEQFVIASGIKENKETGKFEWLNGRYANDLKSISNMQNNSFESMKETLSFLAEYNHSDFIKGIISLEEIEKDADIQEKSKEEISENEQYQTQENTVKENTSLKDNNDQEKQYIKGNLTGDVEVKDLRSNDGQDFRVASFSIAQNDGMGNVKFMNCFAYNEQAQAVKDFRKGDFVSLSGKEKLSIGKNGKQYTNFKVYSAKLLKARGQSQDTKEKPSTLKKLNDYKEKTDSRSKEQGNMKSEKCVER